MHTHACTPPADRYKVAWWRETTWKRKTSCVHCSKLHNPEDHNMNLHCWEKLKSHTPLFVPLKHWYYQYL